MSLSVRVTTTEGGDDSSTLIVGVRVPRSSECARVLYDLATHLVRDDEFLTIAEQHQRASPHQRAATIADLHDRLGLTREPWATKYLRQLLLRAATVRSSDERSRLRALTRIVFHLRHALEFVVKTRAGEKRFIVDPESPRRATVEVVAGDDAAPSATTLEDLERISGAPRQARNWWKANGLPMRRQPIESLRRDTFVYFLVIWKRLTAAQAKVAVADMASAGHIRERADRGRRVSEDGESARGDLSRASIRSAVLRIQKLIGDAPPP